MMMIIIIIDIIIIIIIVIMWRKLRIVFLARLVFGLLVSRPIPNGLTDFSDFLRLQFTVNRHILSKW